ncbi:hypothetical protein [Paenibacillus pini]|uniref:Uncharacterized protein n=1 Tax=Paenibacillus pini JCM 16418 TaxID=1236976 RepID=W7YZ70_9BACL|nr:hypothetical protein [Paenibacillus pini]GAF07664.1 hypothetical protein JCM16418_1692 [Paenibacillus pini JCM 16418]
MPQKNQSPPKRKSPFFAVLGIILSLAAIFVLVGLFTTSKQDKQLGVTEQVLSYAGYTRVIDQQEYQFYEYLAQREMDGVSDSNLLADKTKALAQIVNAQFYLGNKLGLSGPYSFGSMQEQMKQENARRKMEIEKGQVIYGPKTFDIYRYYQYVSSNLEVKIIDYLATNADESLHTMARTYFEENKKKYEHIEKIVYSLTENGKTVENTIDWGQLNTLGKADSELAQILKNGSIDQEFSYRFGNSKRSGKIISVIHVKADFEQQRASITSDFLSNGYYKQLLKEVANNNPIEFAEK